MRTWHSGSLLRWSAVNSLPGRPRIAKAARGAKRRRRRRRLGALGHLGAWRQGISPRTIPSSSRCTRSSRRMVGSSRQRRRGRDRLPRVDAGGAGRAVAVHDDRSCRVHAWRVHRMELLVRANTPSSPAKASRSRWSPGGAPRTLSLGPALAPGETKTVRASLQALPPTRKARTSRSSSAASRLPSPRARSWSSWASRAPPSCSTTCACPPPPTSASTRGCSRTC